MNRSLKLSILMALALGSSQAAAVELGQAHVRSALGQPLLVDIPVTHATPAELQSLSAHLASNDAFAKAGGQPPAIPLQFNVVDDHGHKVIRVTSNSVVDDPYLDLLVEVSSSTGSTVREFAILLDPPGKMAQAPASGAPVRSHPSTSSTPAPVTPVEAPSRPAGRRTTVAEVKNGQIGPVAKGATLSHIAEQISPAGVDIDQMMLALKAANPDAFYRDNINALKAGAILRVPSRNDALTTAVAAAVAAVRQQNSDWHSGNVPSTVAVAAGGTRKNASVAPTANSHADKLELLPPGSGGQSAGGSGGKGGANASIRQELQRSQETLASLTQQSDELKSRLKDLEDINNKNQRLLSLKDDEIADLQKQLAAARKAAGMPPAAVAKAAAKASPTSEASAPAQVKATSAPTVASPASAPKPAAAVARPSTAAHTPAMTAPLSKPTKPLATSPRQAPLHPAAEEPWFMQTWAWAAGGGVIVLLLLGLLARRGKSVAGKKSKGEAAPQVGSLADRFGTVDVDGLDHPSGSSDPDQDELLDQLAEQPDDIGLHLELVSLYYSRRDVEHFEAAAEAMHAHITDPAQPEWQDVVHMGQDLAPGHPLFASAVASPGHAEAPLHHFDLDSYAARAEEASTVAPKSAPTKPSTVSEYHFDFDLTPHADPVLPVTAPAPVQATEPAEEPVSTWKFDEAAEDLSPAVHTDHDAFGELHDDPVDTKLDLARAYLDMGDPDGARAMLEEVMHEGSQIQKDVAKTLMEKLH